MTNPYTAPTLTNYNSSPPPDDGSEVASNQLKWSRHISKIGDPLKTYAQAISGAVEEAFEVLFGNNTNAQSGTYTLLESDRGKLIKCTSTFTLTFLAAADAGVGYVIAIRNSGSGVITLEPDSGEPDTLNGESSVDLSPGGFVIYTSDGVDTWNAIVFNNFLVDGGLEYLANALHTTFEINAQTGTSYTVLASDRAKTITLTNAATIAVTLPEAGTDGFENKFFFVIHNIGATDVTITPTTSTIDGSATKVVRANRKYVVISGGTNYTTYEIGNVAIYPDQGELTIDTGAVTVTGSSHTLDTEGDASTDTLDTINGGVDGLEVALMQENSARDITIGHNTGNILLAESVNFTFNTANDIIILRYVGVLSKWVETSRRKDSGTFTIGTRFFQGETTHDIAVEGAQAITGVGFQPAAVIAIATVPNVGSRASWGFALASGAGASLTDNNAVTGASYQFNSDALIAIQTGSGVAATAALTSVGADGFTITWSKSGSPTGTASIAYMAIR